MKTPNRGVVLALIVAYAAGLVPSVASAQTAARQTATVTANAPIYIAATVSPTPLRVAAPGTVLNVLQQVGDWIQVEFNDPQFGTRVGWVQRPLLKFSTEGLQPTDLSVREAAPEATSPSSRPQAPLAAPQHAGQTSGNSQGDSTMATGMMEGEMLGESLATGGKLGLGVCLGLLTGLIGTGIGYAATGSAPMTAEALQRNSNRSPEYQLGFKSGWDKKTKSKKRSAFLVGGLLGTAAWVAILVSVSNQNNSY